MSNPDSGLTQKQAEQSKNQTDTNFSRKRTLVDPLGIRVDTNLGKRSQTPPEQIFPKKTDRANTRCTSKRGSPVVFKQRRQQQRPKPLQLEVKAPEFSSHHAFRSSLNETPTPIIIITPTHDDTPKVQTQSRLGGLRRPRIASSIYTVPSAWQSAISPLQRSRTFSDVTTGRDDSTPPFGVGESFRNRDAIRRSSIAGTVLATPYRSSGWWNVITSPFAGRSSVFASSNSADNSDPTEQTPLCESAAPTAYGCSRTVAEGEHDHTRAHQDAESGPFRYYSVPMTGEASKYYDQSYDYSTPALLSADIPTPDVPHTARSDFAPFSPDDGEVPILLAGEAPHLQESSRKVPMPELPSQTPPQSSRAAVIETFAAARSPIIDSRTAYLTKSIAPEDLLSPTLPSPVVEIASVGIVQTARTVESDSARTPVPTFRPVTIDGTVNTDAERRGLSNADAPRTEAPKVNKPSLASAYSPWTNRTAVSSTATFVSNPSPAARASSRPTTEKTRSLPFRQLYSASTDSNRPLMSSQGQRRKQFDTEKQSFPKDKKRGKRFRWTKEKALLLGISAILFIAVLLAVVLCMTVAQDQSSIPVESQWLNLTGFPPLPTGISTISEPRPLKAVSGCVAPSEMWSCELPKGQQKPDGTSQPSFRLLILFNNQSISNPALTQPATARRALGNVSPTAYARFRVRRSLLRVRNAVSAIMLSPLPPPPSSQDQEFLGRTTDDANRPFDGADTPFFISLLPTTTVPEGAKALRRSVESSTSVSGPLSKIPSPSLGPDGKAEGPELHPFPEAQPLKLFNHGLPTEHYGFYSYFDKSIFLSSPAANSSSNAAAQSAALNKDGGAPARDANAICTWSQTRLLVQIWTKTDAALLPGTGQAQATSAPITHGPNGTASAFDFSRPGSFPWPVTVTVDRHGGNAAQKGIYCYGVDEDGVVVTDQRAMHPEDRGYGGELVNPAPHAFTAVELAGDGGRYGGIDGGTGGCLCQWANWQ